MVEKTETEYTIYTKNIVLIIIVILVNQINSKYKWNNIQRSINNLCKEKDDRARLLGFKNIQSAKEAISYIRQM